MNSTHFAAKFVRRVLVTLLPSLLIASLGYAPMTASASDDKRTNGPGINTAATTVTFRSVGKYDGWTEESSENSEQGGSSHNIYEKLWVGDGANDEQYRAILSFNATSLPDNVTITAIRLKLKYADKMGSLPFNTHNGLVVDVNIPAFYGSPFIGDGALPLHFGDFEAAATKLAIAQFSPTPVNGWYTASIPVQYVSKTKTTQFRLRFRKGDNDDRSADLIGFFQGDASVIANRPRLIITYIQ